MTALARIMVMKTILLLLSILNTTFTYAEDNDPFREIYDETIGILQMEMFFGEKSEEFPEVNYRKALFHEDDFQQRMEALRRRLSNLPENRDYGIIKSELASFLNQSSINIKECRYHEWSFVESWDPVSYFYQFAYYNSSKPVKNVENYKFISTAINNLAQALSFYNRQAETALLNYAFPSRAELTAMRDQLKKYFNNDILQFYLYSLSRKYECSECEFPREKLKSEFTNKVLTEAKKYGETLEKLMKKASETAYVIPKAFKENCMVKTMYNVGGMLLSPSEVLKMGEDNLESANAEMLKIMREELNNENLTKAQMNDYLRSIREDQLVYTDSQEYMDIVHDAIVRSENFARTITTKETQYPQVNDLNYETDRFAATYRDCQINVNSKAPSLKYAIAALMIHEGIPGHHLDLCKHGHGPDFTPREDELNNFFSNTDRIEGWAFYVEELAYEQGFYSSALEKIGFLEWQRVRSLRLILTYKYFFENWTMKEAEKFHRENSVVPDTSVSSEVNRATHHSGQVLNYLIGRESIKEMREKAKRELGENFSLTKFHDFILQNQNYSLAAIRGEIDNFIDANR